MNKLDIVITAAGKGTRLQPFTFEKPKCLIPIKDKTLLEHQISALSEVKGLEIDKIVIVGGYLIDSLQKFIKKSKIINKKMVSVVNNKDYDKTSCGYSLVQGLRETENDVLHFNSDVLFYSYVIDDLVKSKHDNCILTKELDCNFKMGEKTLVNNSDLILYIGKGNICRYNKYAVGPTLLSKKAVDNTISIFKYLQIGEQNSIHCLPLFGLFAEKHELYSVDVDDYRCIEVNSNLDWMIAERFWRF